MPDSREFPGLTTIGVSVEDERARCAQAWKDADAVADFDRVYWLMAHRETARSQVLATNAISRERYQELKAACEKAVKSAVMLGAQALGIIRNVLRDHEEQDGADGQ